MNGLVERLFIDTNILIYACIQESPFHQLSLSKLKEFETNNTKLYISHQIIREFLAVLSRPTIQSEAITKEILLKIVDHLRIRFSTTIEKVDILDYLIEMFNEIEIGGKQIHDANIVATMRANNIRYLWTHNTQDFSRYLRWIHVIPLLIE